MAIGPTEDRRMYKAKILELFECDMLPKHANNLLAHIRRLRDHYKTIDYGLMEGSFGELEDTAVCILIDLFDGPNEGLAQYLEKIKSEGR